MANPENNYVTVTQALVDEHPHLAKKLGKTVSWAEVKKVKAAGKKPTKAEQDELAKAEVEAETKAQEELNAGDDEK